MKFFFIYLISFISIFQLLHSIELGGIKFAITEKMAYQSLDFFCSNINKEIISMDLENIKLEKGITPREIKAGIPNFTSDKIKFSFKEDGININISGLKAWINGTLYYKGVVPLHERFEINVKEFNLNLNLRVFGKNEGNRLIPWVEYSQTPPNAINYNNVDDFFYFKNINVVYGNKVINKIINSFNNLIKDKSNKILEDILSFIPIIMPVDESKGLFIDFSLVDNIKMKKGYFEVNSYAFFYNENKSQTKNKKNFPLGLLPSITTIDNPNQIFVSQYSINSALFTYFITNPLSLKIDVNNNILEYILPSLFSKFSGQQIKVYLETSEPPTLEFEQNYITGIIKGKIIVNVDGKNEPIFICSIEMPIKVKIVIIQNIQFSGKIDELSIKVGEISVNETNSEFLSEYIGKLIPIFLSTLNEYIARNLKFSFPTFCQNISVKHNGKYLVIDYILTKN